MRAWMLRVAKQFDGNEEYNVIAVKPDAASWVWIGRLDGSEGLPVAYDLTICGTEATP